MKYISLMLFLTLATGLFASDRDERNADSAKPVAVAGGVKFSVPTGFDTAFKSVVNALQKRDYVVEAANKDAGQIFTALVITGKGRQTGTRLQVTVIEDTPTSTIVRIAATEMHRYKVFQADPWSEPGINQPQTELIASALKSALAGH
jgi:uncharacterized protein (DUF2126 family)